MAVISRAARDRIFGAPGKVDKVQVVTPWGLTVQCHRLIAALFLQACREAYDTVPHWRPKRIDSFNFRPIRGSKSPSMHGYALAWDFFITGPTTPPPGGVWTPDNPVPPEFAACFTRRGFRWGATFDRVDLPHIEWPGGLPTGIIPGPVQPPAPIEEDDFMADPHGTARMLMRIYLGRNPNNQAELDLHAYAVAKDGLNARAQALADSPEGKAWEAKQRAA